MSVSGTLWYWLHLPKLCNTTYLLKSKKLTWWMHAKIYLQEVVCKALWGDTSRHCFRGAVWGRLKPGPSLCLGKSPPFSATTVERPITHALRTLLININVHFILTHFMFFVAVRHKNRIWLSKVNPEKIKGHLSIRNSEPGIFFFQMYFSYFFYYDVRSWAHSSVVGDLARLNSWAPIHRTTNVKKKKN